MILTMAACTAPKRRQKCSTSDGHRLADEPVAVRHLQGASLTRRGRPDAHNLGFAQASKRIRCQAGVDLLSRRAGRHACDPETPPFVARAGSEVRLRVVHPGGHTRQQAFTLVRWP